MYSGAAVQTFSQGEYGARLPIRAGKPLRTGVVTPNADRDFGGCLVSQVLQKLAGFSSGSDCKGHSGIVVPSAIVVRKPCGAKWPDWSKHNHCAIAEIHAGSAGAAE